MNDHSKQPTTIRGEAVTATYRDKDSEDADFADNPLILALPASWEWDGEETPIMDKLTKYFAIDRKALAKMPTYQRIVQLTKFKLQFFQVLGRHRDLERSISLAIRFGYLGRNLADPRFRRNLHDRISAFNQDAPVFISAANLGFALLGSPGLGKTTSIARILRLYPQVIHHRSPELHHTQVVWLFLTCPHDKSTRGLCLLFFKEVDNILGTDHLREYSRDNESNLIAGMDSVAADLSLGMLIIDEIQFLSAGKSGGKDDMLKFFVQLENTLGIPIVLVGTHRASKLIAGSPHLARRSVGMGGKTWKPLRADDPEWEIFISAMWEHQFVKNTVELNPDIMREMYNETQGYLNYAVDLFYYVQRDAIDDGSETISIDSLSSAAARHLEYSRPYISALRSGDHLYAEILEDMIACDFESHHEFFNDRLPLALSQASNIKVDGVANRSEQPNGKRNIASAEIQSFQPPPPSSPPVGAAPIVPKRRRSKRIDCPVGSIMAICQEGVRRNNIAPYEALKDANLIRSAAEFLPAMSA
jgi:hypothetical protein